MALDIAIWVMTSCTHLCLIESWSNDKVSDSLKSKALTEFDGKYKVVNPLPNDKILDWSKLKAFADYKINVAEKLKAVLEQVENITGKGENAGYQHFLLFPKCFQKPSLSGLLKVGIVLERVKM